MELAVRGHPLHTRSLAVRVVQGEAGGVEAAGELVDLRKRGFVPVAADLQPSGVVHHMLVDAAADLERGVLERIATRQPTVAFEPSAMTRGESCRDPAERLAELAGSALDSGAPGRLMEVYGGPRGCSHVLVLARLVLSVLHRTRGDGFRPGETRLHRALCLDGHEAAPGRVELAVQLTDLAMAPSPAVAPAMDRFAGQHEVRLLATVDVESASLAALRGARRRRTAATLETADWEPLDDRLAELAGAKVLAGFSRTVLARLDPESPEDAPLADALLNVGPAFLQCMGTLSEGWPIEARRRRALVATGGMPDSCWMWRREGPLTRALEREVSAHGPVLSARPGKGGRS